MQFAEDGSKSEHVNKYKTARISQLATKHSQQSK